MFRLAIAGMLFIMPVPALADAFYAPGSNEPISKAVLIDPATGQAYRADAPSGGGSGSSIVTANQGTAGTAAWPVTWTNQSVSISSLPLATNAATNSSQTVVQSAPGTSAATANAVQGVTGGLPIAVQGMASGVPVATSPQDVGSGSGSVTSVATIFTVDTAGYGGLVVQTTSIGTGNTITFTGSNDNNNFVTAIGFRCDSISAATTSTLTVAGGVCFSSSFRYIRAAVTTYGSGTVSAVYTLRIAGFNPSVVNQGAGTTGFSWGMYSNANASTGGVSNFSRIPSSAASTNTTLVKSTAARLFKVYACNVSMTFDVYIHFTNSATAPTPGTTAVNQSRMFPRTANASVPNCQSYDMSDIGFSYTTGLGYWLSKGSGVDTDATALSASDLTQLEVGYQ